MPFDGVRAGRLLTAFQVQPGLFVKPYYTDDPLGATGWKQGAFTNQPNIRRSAASWSRAPAAAPLRGPVQVGRVQLSEEQVWRGFLYAAYGTNKEDVQLSRVPSADLVRRRPPWAR
ncbi:hypothetical protein [Nonomuraea sp. B1E8]|uniref:hypothetical protein n=1 Tax=unclassified Nonomuraea TaxID=2593643 RepID=UPI00325DE44C